MKNNKIFNYILLLSITVFSCVPQRKLEEEKAKRTSCETELNDLKAKHQTVSAKLTEDEQELVENGKVIASLQKDTALLGGTYRNIVEKYDKLNSVNEQLLEKFNRLVVGNIEDTKKLAGELQLTQEELLKKADEQKVLAKQLSILESELKQREARVAELEQVLKSKDDAVQALKQKLVDALYAFEGKGLTVTQKNGKVYVSMDESLLFASGSTTVEKKGVDALKKVALVLEQNPDINILIEGHTDDVPMAGSGAIKDNWDLSVIRATSIVKIIIQNSKVVPSRLTAAGRGEYSPVDTAKTKEARSKNRRTEIILTPKLNELFKVLESN
jgi:chemotaxis protein MotB